MPLISRPIILASGSPYRRKLLEEAGIKFSVDVSNVDEDLHPLTDPEKSVKDLQRAKRSRLRGARPKTQLSSAPIRLALMGPKSWASPATPPTRNA